MRYSKRKILFSASLLIGAVIVLLALELTNTTHLFHHQPVAQVTGSPETKGVKHTPTQTSSNTDTLQPTTNSSSSNNDKAASNPPGVKLYTPRGPFVSDHRPNLSSHPAPNRENSVCSTTSGATCQIVFTKDGVTKKLPSQMTDAGGATYWNGWKLQDVGLTAGGWKITAVAKLGSQTVTADDALPLTVSP